MLLMRRDVDVSHVTTHVALRRVPDLVTRERVLKTIRLARRTMAPVGKPHARIAVAGLNPHAGDELFGDGIGPEVPAEGQGARCRRRRSEANL